MTSFHQRMAELRLRFIDRARNDRGRLQDALDAGDRSEVQRISHRLAGLAGTFGFGELSTAAAEVDSALDDGTIEPEQALITPLLDQLADIHA